MKLLVIVFFFERPYIFLIRYFIS